MTTWEGDDLIAYGSMKHDQVSEVIHQFTKRLDRKLRVENRIHKCRGSDNLLDWATEYLPKHYSLPPSELHRWLAKELHNSRTRRGARINIIGPRGAAKSTIATLAHILRCALEGTEPYVWIVSTTKHQACAHLDNVKTELTENAAIANDYPESSSQGSVWRASHIVLRNGVHVEAFGAGQRIRGRRRGSHRPSLILCDDIQSDEHARSTWLRETSRQWFDGTLLKAGDRKTNVVNLATALHRDAIGMDLHRRPGWNSKLFAALQKWPENKVLWEKWQQIYCNRELYNHLELAEDYYKNNKEAMDRGAVLLWPECESIYSLMCMRVDSGSVAFDREKQGVPLSGDLCEFPEEYFQKIVWFETWPDKPKIKLMALDPSKGRDAHRGDYSAYVMLSIDNNDNYFVQADMQRRPVAKLVADGVKLFREFEPDAFGVESNQFQELLCTEFERHIDSSPGTNYRPWSINNHKSKLVRIGRLGQYLSANRIRFKQNCRDTQLLIDQLREFPLGDHDDGPDALEMAIRLADEVLHVSTNPDRLGENLLS